eukprot:Gregarina_sp_Pseudo_9__2273@NODE_25_length_5633_cov_38_635860_g23_i0_p8_GENE_NODE_25_length_5633_cov_38_635860_g23_i0NODE_25_length_5633_cov_38_635860_g23_i0_p8_ORF_typecomplete_len104_score17_97CbiC/PF02570_15/0_23_NODE_25_length_5633_cov_38_635860_g23_i043114622
MNTADRLATSRVSLQRREWRLVSRFIMTLADPDCREFVETHCPQTLDQCARLAAEHAARSRSGRNNTQSLLSHRHAAATHFVSKANRHMTQNYRYMWKSLVTR